MMLLLYLWKEVLFCGQSFPYAFLFQSSYAYLFQNSFFNITNN